VVGLGLLGELDWLGDDVESLLTFAGVPDDSEALVDEADESDEDDESDEAEDDDSAVLFSRLSLR
jgi:hypothetical protein